MNRLDHLLSTKRDQNADDNNSNFTGELTPAVKRLRQMEVHVRSPPATRET